MTGTKPRDRIAIVGMGAVTSVGLYPEAIAAAVAGGITRIRTVETMRHPLTGEAVRLAPLQRLPLHLPAPKRLQWMGMRAAGDALTPLAAVGGRLRLGTLTAMPPAHRGIGRDVLRRTAGEMMQGLRVPSIAAFSGIYDRGNDGGMMALARARQLLAGGEVDACLVGGVDSYCDADALDVLGKANRLKAEDASAGLIPGEGAAFVSVMRADVVQQLGLVPLAYLLDVALCEEPNPWHSGRSTLAQGLTTAIADVFAGKPPSVIAAATYCDANGEHWRVDEWSFAYLRTSDRHADPLDIRHPADCWGDVGAASAMLLLVTGMVDYRRGRVRGPQILVWCANDMGTSRGALLVEVQPGKA